MNPMKKLIILQLIISLAFLACQRDANDFSPLQAEQIEMEKSLQDNLQHNAKLSSLEITSRSNYPNSCQLPVCEIVLENQYDILLQKANATCLTMSNCIECCMNDWAVSIILYVKPTAPQCNKLDYNSTLIENF